MKEQPGGTTARQHWLSEQRRRWHAGERIIVEELIRGADAEVDDDLLLDLIYGKLRLREQQGETVADEEYFGRFPHLADQLKPLLEVHRAISDGHAPPTQVVPTQAESLSTTGPPGGAVSPHAADALADARFQILRPHAAGGLGAVFVAMDLELHREVALKRIRRQLADNPDNRSRFVIEAEITGGLEHPGIVPVYSLGSDAAGEPYYAMRFIRGESLKEAIARLHDPSRSDKHSAAWRLEFRRLLGCFIEVCQAIEYAHSRGVVHRDLKPANIMLGDYGETLVVDWGLAKSVGRKEWKSNAPDVEATLRPQSASGATSTRFGSALGTPQYMSPEQAAGRFDVVGPASDIYSLGATLYHLLTGRAPLQGGNVGEILQKVQRGDYPPPRTVNSQLPRALESVCLKAMALEPADRYPSARALAADIEHHLADEKTTAHRERVLERLGRVVRRHRTATLAIGAVLLAITVASLIAAVLINEQRSVADQQRRAAEDQRQVAQQLAQDNAALAKAEREALDRAEETLYFSRVNLAHTEWYGNNVGRAEELLDLCPAERRGWEWHFLKRICHRDLVTLTHSGPSPAAASWVWRVAYSPDGRWLAIGGPNSMIRVVEASTGKLRRTMRAPGGFVMGLAFHPTKLLLASASTDGTVCIWQPLQGKQVERLERPQQPLHKVAFSPDGKLLVAASRSADSKGAIFAWAWQSGERVWSPPLNEVRAFAFSPNGQLLAIATEDRAVLWDWMSQEVQHELKGHTSNVISVAFSPDGQLVATGSKDRTIRLWDSSSGQLVRVIRGHAGPVASVSFHPQGHLLAACDEQNLVKVWDVDEGVDVRSFRGHQARIQDVQFNPDGLRLATASADGTAKIWDALAPPEEQVSKSHPGHITDVAFAPDSRHVASAATGEVLIWKADTGEVVRTIPCADQGSRPGTRLAFQPHGRGLAITSDDGSVTIHDVDGAMPARSYRKNASPITALAYSADGRQLACGDTALAVVVWDAKSGEVLHALTHPQSIRNFDAIWDLAFSADGCYLISTGRGTESSVDNSVVLWDLTAPTGPEPRPIVATARTVPAFSSDGRMLAFADNEAIPLHRLSGEKWTLETTASPWELHGHTGQIYSLAFSPDSKRLISAGADHTVRVWDTATVETTLILKGHEDYISQVAISPNGNKIASASRDGTVRIWDGTPWPDKEEAAASK